jgi:outer membrane protein OmpA-like peptidoglycan-associated protein
MWRSHRTIVVIVVGLLGMAVWPVGLEAQLFKDCRVSGGCTEEDYARVLFPDTAPSVGIRGVAPVRPAEPTAARPAVALNVLFEFNSDKIPPRYYGELDKLGKVLAQPQHAASRIGIEGHTDSIGSDRYNQSLSEKRAASVKRYLVQHFAIPSERLIVKGFGKNKPRASNDTPEGREENRRVEVVNLDK